MLEIYVYYKLRFLFVIKHSNLSNMNNAFIGLIY